MPFFAEDFVPQVFSRTLLALILLSPGPLLHAGTYVQFRLPFGDVEVELFDEDKPITTRNFLRYVQSGLYEDMFLHRWLPGFVVQGGGFFDPFRPTNTFFAFGVIPAAFGQITNEFNVGPRIGNTYGTLAMAKTPDGPNTASSQWFFNLGNNSTNLDNQNGGFTVFGRVIRGTNILNRFNNPSPTNALFILSLDPPLDEMPVVSNQFGIVHCDISLLNVQVAALQSGAREISWTSVAAKTNRVQYTTNLPPVWHTLLTTNGTGARFRVTDPADAPQRFYRVRVDF
ncbi:MAG: peptidylprolyl isomerase [Verrucomicrobia subdivision 3 bacterium]|nr:peptidylprolyl isomerase [Limisphaerales bacterium]